MTLPLDILLVLGVLGFYLYDSSMLLFTNEVVLEESWGRWRYVLPKTDWLILNKSLHIPNPLTPDAAVYRVHWPALPAEVGACGMRERFMDSLGALRFFTLLLFGLLFMGLPTITFLYDGGAPLLSMIGSIYLCICALLLVAYHKRKRLGISFSWWLLRSFESLACPPFALNLLRKVTLNHGLLGDPADLAKSVLTAADFQALVSALRQRIDEEKQGLASSNDRYALLSSYQGRLKEMLDDVT